MSCILYSNPLSDILVSIFSYLVDCLFILLRISFAAQGCLIWFSPTCFFCFCFPCLQMPCFHFSVLHYGSYSQICLLAQRFSLQLCHQLFNILLWGVIFKLHIIENFKCIKSNIIMNFPPSVNTWHPGAAFITLLVEGR